MRTFDRVFAALFGGPSPFRDQVPPIQPAFQRAEQDGGPQPAARSQGDPGGWSAGMQVSASGSSADDADEPLAEGPALRHVASAAERLRGRDFTELSPAELRQLVTLMREMTLAALLRRTRRYRPACDGKRPDLRRTLRLARRSGGEAIRLAAPGPAGATAPPGGAVRHLGLDGALRPRAAAAPVRHQRRPGARRVVGSEPARGVQLRDQADQADAGTRRGQPGHDAGQGGRGRSGLVGGPRIARAQGVQRHYGSRGMARGAVVLIISDGWETGEPELLGAQMARLSRVARRIVWANPRPSLRVTARRSAAWPPRGRTATRW